MSGAQCVTTPGRQLMPEWRADNWDSPDSVSVHTWLLDIFGITLSVLISFNEAQCMLGAYPPWQYGGRPGKRGRNLYTPEVSIPKRACTLTFIMTLDRSPFPHVSFTQTHSSLTLCCYFSPDAQAFSFARFGPGTGPILLDNVACNGTESRLIDCTNNGIGIHNCLHSEDASVRCDQNCKEGRKEGRAGGREGGRAG